MLTASRKSRGLCVRGLLPAFLLRPLAMPATAGAGVRGHHGGGRDGSSRGTTTAALLPAPHKNLKRFSRVDPPWLAFSRRPLPAFCMQLSLPYAISEAPHRVAAERLAPLRQRDRVQWCMCIAVCATCAEKMDNMPGQTRQNRGRRDCPKCHNQRVGFKALVDARYRDELCHN